MKSNTLIFILLLTLMGGKVIGQVISDEAQRHFDRGVTAVEMAKSPMDYESAIREFEQAIILAPKWPDVYYNLGLVQEKAEKYTDAVTNLRQYLNLVPVASDAEMVKSLINKLEYKRDKANKKKEIVEALTGGGTIHKKGGSDGGICVTEKFAFLGDQLSANIRCMDSGYNQTVNVAFDGSILKFKYIYYGCANRPKSENFPCAWAVSIVAEVMATSPLRLKVHEEWIRQFAGEARDSSDGEWEFSR